MFTVSSAIHVCVRMHVSSGPKWMELPPNHAIVEAAKALGGRGVARNLIWGVYVLTSHCNFKTYVNVPHVNLYHIESVLGHRRRTTT